MSRHIRGKLIALVSAAAVFCFSTSLVQAAEQGRIVGQGDGVSMFDGDIWGITNPPRGNDFISVSFGLYHGLALKSDGSIIGWGRNDNLMGTWTGQATPPDGNDFVAISAGSWHSLALKSDGTIAGWGWNYYNQAAAPEETGFFAIAAGDYYSVALWQCTYSVAGDLNNDCRVDIADFAQFASNWLVDCFNEPNNPACVHK